MKLLLYVFIGFACFSSAFANADEDEFLITNFKFAEAEYLEQKNHDFAREYAFGFVISYSENWPSVLGPCKKSTTLIGKEANFYILINEDGRIEDIYSDNYEKIVVCVMNNLMIQSYPKHKSGIVYMKANFKY